MQDDYYRQNGFQYAYFLFVILPQGGVNSFANA